MRTPRRPRSLDRIAVTRSLHELWHLRGEVFSLVSRRHDQAEADAGWPRSTATSRACADAATPLALR